MVSREINNSIEAFYSEIDLAVTQFDHPNWARADPIRIARLWSGEEASHSHHAEARIIWSDSALTVRFVCNQKDPPIVRSNPLLNEKTIGLWERDVCEIFMAPNNASPNHYFEFEAAPTGEWVDLAIKLRGDERDVDQEFHSGMTTAARMSGDQLTIILRIPWGNSIPKPERGNEWRVNLFRCSGTGDGRYLAWLPTYTPEPNFHVPEAFGWLRFI